AWGAARTSAPWDGRRLGAAGEPTADDPPAVLIAERREPRARRVRQRAVALDTDPLAREPRQDRGLVPRSGADLEHAMLRPHAELLGHVGDHIGLTDGLAAGDRQRLVRIGGIGEPGVDEVLARHLVD